MSSSILGAGTDPHFGWGCSANVSREMWESSSSSSQGEGQAQSEVLTFFGTTVLWSLCCCVISITPSLCLPVLRASSARGR